MELSQLLKEARLQRLFDVAEPYLWSQEELVSYFDAAQDKFFELTGWVIDSTSSLTKLTVKAGQGSVARSDRIVRVLNAVVDDGSENGRPLVLLPAVPLRRMPGTPNALAVGMDTNAFVFDKVPDVPTTIYMRVERRALEPIESTGSELEVPSAYARTLLDFVEFLAYSKPDTETHDMRKAREAVDRFAIACDRIAATKRRGTTPVLTTGYGGI